MRHAAVAVLSILLAAPTVWGQQPTATAWPTSTVDACDYPDAATAQAAWRAMWGTASAEPVVIDGRKTLRLPCNFRGTRIDRACWDRSVRLDMTACRGITLQLRCHDTAPVSGFTLYMKSGDGWYAGHFAVTPSDVWTTVTIPKEDTQLEGRPAGWGQVETLRLSAWRGRDADTEIHLAGVALVPETSDIVIVRGESALARVPREAESVTRFAKSVASRLADLGLSFGFVSDLDLTAERLSGRRLVILPHNPAMADSAADALGSFLDGGGRMLAFYSIPDKLAKAAGIRWVGHVSQRAPGQFASIRFAEGVLAGAPAEVGQASWNIMDVRPVEGRSLTAATWFDSAGRDTGHPAIVVSEKCIYMTHVLLTDDLARKRRMVLAMVGHLVPEAWQRAASAAVEGVGRFGRFAGLDDVVRQVEPQAASRPDARDCLGRALTQRDRAAALLRDGKPHDALAAADEAGRLAIEGWCRAQAHLPGEHRAMWCHNAYGPDGTGWEEAIRRLSQSGLTAILPNMCWGDVAYYGSAVLPVAPEVRQRGDALAQCLAACRKFGVQCHVWKVNWHLSGYGPKEYLERLKEEGRLQVHFDGRPRNDWLCPSHPENRRVEIEAMVELATRFAVDGIHFDYIRYPDRDGCFCGRCRQRFEASLGRPVAEWPADVRRDPALEARWLQWRREQITHVVAATSEAVRKARPACRISAAVFPNWSVDRDVVGQDWRLWCERGYLDFVCPMDYTPHLPTFENLVRMQKEWAGRVPCYPGIGLSVWPTPGDVPQLIDFVTAARRLGTGGFTIFQYGAAEMADVLPLCALGLTRRQ